MKCINPSSELHRDLVLIQNPARYFGGEYGQIIKQSAALTFALSFPDLYEIAMSNLAIKILYDGLNRLSDVRCERVFAPAPDFEELLKRKSLPLYTLESGIPINEVDILGISIGYEPGITGLLAILDTGCIPLECADRDEKDPIVLAGGCGITNPAPFSRFIDAFFIGEAEGGLFTLIQEVAQKKRNGASRADLLEHISNHPSVWTETKNLARKAGQICARKSIYRDFGSSKDQAVCFPVPNMRVVHDHGAVEIMRGCPNGCRFCHAGLYYRPQRMMDIKRIISDVDFLVSRGGYREISLMSLSSGDFNGIDELLSVLTTRFSHKNVSFQLPSLKVNSFTLPLLEKMSEIRKSGLTFAVETPVDAWQLALNKEVYKEKIISIIQEAKKRGWGKAKFYFMIGLPVERDGKKEEVEIVNFLLEIQERTRIQCTVNVGAFIPKPHTPYQWSKQLDMKTANYKLEFIRKTLNPSRFKVSTPRSFDSFVEAMMSRGDKRVGSIILESYKRGCRLDAWDEWARPDIWKAVIADAPWNVEHETIRERSLDEDLPWDGVSLGASKAYLKKEKLKSDNQELTKPCETVCEDSCGICGKNTIVKTIEIPKEKNNLLVDIPISTKQGKATHRVVLSFTKKKEATFIPHLGLIEIWNKAFQRSGLPVIYTQGFNPLPRFEIAQNLSLGVSSDEEIASFLFNTDISSEHVIKTINDSLPENLSITRAFVYPLTEQIRREALTKFLWGNRYQYSFYEQETMSVFLATDIMQFVQNNPGTEFTISQAIPLTIDIQLPINSDRSFRNLLEEIVGKKIYKIVKIHKTASLAHTMNDSMTPVSFFEAFAEVDSITRNLLSIKNDMITKESQGV